ncbi:MAG: 5' nucleotidase, NT5C type [Clostridium sp.]
MNIGIDIDGVITNVEEYMLSYCSKFCYENKINLEKGDKTDYSPRVMYNLTDKENEELWKKIINIYGKTVIPRMYVTEVINKLYQDHDIHIITARTFEKEFYDTEDKIKEGREETIQWLKKYDIPYNTITFAENKDEVVKEKNIDLMIEDSPDNIKSLEDYCKILVFNAVYNQDVKHKRVYSWYEILYTIENMKY